MQRIALVLFAACAAVATVLAIQYRAALSERDARIQALTDRLEDAQKARKAAIDETAPLRENVERLTAERDRLKAGARPSTADASGPAKPGAPDAATPADGGRAMMGGLAKMFQTDEGKKMLRAQTEMMLKMQYSDLPKMLKLSPQETEVVMALLADRQTAIAGNTFGAFSGDQFDETKLKEIGAKAEATGKEFNEKLKAALGDERFAQLEAYDRTLGERMMLTQLEPQLSAAGAPLDGAQRDQLLQIMSEERAKLPKSALSAGNTDPAGAFAAMKDEGAVNQWMQQQEQFQQRVLDAAAGALNPDQINVLRQGFQQQLEMQKFGLKMSREMFKGGGGAVVIPGPAPR
jgi:hypothetical protein